MHLENHSTIFENISFVIVRPSYKGNLGAIARVMKNFNLSNLKIVQAQINYLEQEDEWMSVKAFHILKEANCFNTLKEAIAEHNFVLATSSSRERDCQVEELSSCLEDFIRIAQTNKVSIVFGSERNGLEKDELAICNKIANIRTNPDFSVLNLAQAVALISYEIFKAVNQFELNEELKENSKISLSSLKEDLEIKTLIDKLLKNVDYTRNHNHKLILEEFFQAYRRSGPSRREYTLLKGIILRLLSRLEKT